VRVLIVTPAPRGSQRGNRATAERWARQITVLGHEVEVASSFTNQACDVLLALHAQRSAGSVERYRAARPSGRYSVVLTGTDVYGADWPTVDARAVLAHAERIVALEPNSAARVPDDLRGRVRVILQSVEDPPVRQTRDDDHFRVCVLGHLRPVKDPFRVEEAVRSLPADSRIQVVHVGAALDEACEASARRRTAENPRYRWLDEVPHREALQLLADSDLHVLSSEIEGGANALCEALACGTATLASDVAGLTGILGAGYPGLFQAGDTAGLARLMRRAEAEPAFLRELQGLARELAPTMAPERERADLELLLARAAAS